MRMSRRSWSRIARGQPFATWQLPAGSGIARLERVVADLALPGPRDRAGGARRHRRRPRRRARPWPSVLRIPAWRRGRHSRLPRRQRDRCVYQLATPAAQHRFAVARAGGRRPRVRRERAFAQRRPIDCRTQPARRRLQCIARRIRRVAEHAARRERVARTQGDARCAHGAAQPRAVRVASRTRPRRSRGDGAAGRDPVSRLRPLQGKSTTASATTPATRC